MGGSGAGSILKHIFSGINGHLRLRNWFLARICHPETAVTVLLLCRSHQDFVSTFSSIDKMNDDPDHVGVLGGECCKGTHSSQIEPSKPMGISPPNAKGHGSLKRNVTESEQTFIGFCSYSTIGYVLSKCFISHIYPRKQVRSVIFETSEK